MTETTPWRARLEYGALSAVMKDHLYLMNGGTIYTTPWVSSPATLRRAVAISLTARGATFEFGVGSAKGEYQAVVARPLVKRSIHANDVRLVTALIDPTHPQFRAFRTIPAPGFAALPRERYSALDAALDAAYHGKLTAPQARELYKGLIDTTLDLLPPAAPSDARVDKVIALLNHKRDCSSKELAEAVGLSFSRMSHLFTEAMGVSLRSYQLCLKVQDAVNSYHPRQRLTDVAIAGGFADLAHFSRVVQQTFGAPLSYFRDSDRVEVFPCREHDKAEPGEAPLSALKVS